MSAAAATVTQYKLIACPNFECLSRLCLPLCGLNLMIMSGHQAAVAKSLIRVRHRRDGDLSYFS